MSTRIILIDHVVPTHTKDGDQCTSCPRRTGASCFHFGDLKVKEGTKRTFLRHAKCARAEERTRHAASSALLLGGDFEED